MKKLSLVALGLMMSAGALPVQADEIKVLAGNLPPMFLDDGKGREAEIITAVMEKCGHTVSYEIQPFTRHWESYKSGAGDAVATVPQGMPIDGTPSDVYIQYQNGVSFLTDSGASYDGLADLAGKKVIGFKGRRASFRGSPTIPAPLPTIAKSPTRSPRAGRCSVGVSTPSSATACCLPNTISNCAGRAIFGLTRTSP